MLCVRKTRIASVASDPSVCTKSARASLYARRNAVQKPISSSASTGTTSPNAASQTSPGRMKNAVKNGNGRNTSTPPASARATATGRSDTSATAPTYERLRSRPPTTGTTTSSSVSSRTRASRFRIAGGTPSASDGQKRRP